MHAMTFLSLTVAPCVGMTSRTFQGILRDPLVEHVVGVDHGVVVLPAIVPVLEAAAAVLGELELPDRHGVARSDVWDSH